MKKLLNLLGALGLVASTGVTSVVACGGTPSKKDDDSSSSILSTDVQAALDKVKGASTFLEFKTAVEQLQITNVSSIVVISDNEKGNVTVTVKLKDGFYFDKETTIFSKDFIIVGAYVYVDPFSINSEVIQTDLNNCRPQDSFIEFKTAAESLKIEHVQSIEVSQKNSNSKDAIAEVKLENGYYFDGNASTTSKQFTITSAFGELVSVSSTEVQAKLDNLKKQKSYDDFISAVSNAKSEISNVKSITAKNDDKNGNVTLTVTLEDKCIFDNDESTKGGSKDFTVNGAYLISVSSSEIEAKLDALKNQASYDDFVNAISKLSFTGVDSFSPKSDDKSGNVVVSVKLNSGYEFDSTLTSTKDFTVSGAYVVNQTINSSDIEAKLESVANANAYDKFTKAVTNLNIEHVSGEIDFAGNPSDSKEVYVTITLEKGYVFEDGSSSYTFDIKDAVAGPISFN